MAQSTAISVLLDQVLSSDGVPSVLVTGGPPTPGETIVAYSNYQAQWGAGGGGTGTMGATGAQGPQGVQGATGPMGATGTTPTTINLSGNATGVSNNNTVISLTANSPQYTTVTNGGGVLMQLGLLGGQAGTSYSAIYPGNLTPGTANYVLYWDNSTSSSGPYTTSINGDSLVYIRVGGAVIGEIGSTYFGFLQPLYGIAQPLAFGATSGALSVTANIVLTTPEQQTPVIQLTGVVNTGGITITLPNVVGSYFLFDITGITLAGSNNIVFTTGSGTTATITTSTIAVTQAVGLNLITVCVVASNFVSIG